MMETLKETEWWQCLWIDADNMHGYHLQAALNQQESESPYSIFKECLVSYNFEWPSVVSMKFSNQIQLEHLLRMDLKEN